MDGDAEARQRVRLFSSPSGMAVDNVGNLYFSDLFAKRVRVISAAGTISTFAGGGSQDGGLATSASLYNPGPLAVDGVGNLFIADKGKPVLRKVSGGMISTVTALASGPGVGGFPFSGDSGLAADNAGNIYISDSRDGRVRKLTPTLQTCTYTLNPTSSAVAAAGGLVTVSVTTSVGCAWQVSFPDVWVAVTGSSTTRVDSGSIVLSVAPNLTGPARSSAVQIAGQTFTVNQAGSGCVYAATPSAVNIPANGQTGVLTFTAQTGVNCTWNATTSSNWIQFLPATGQGTGTTNYTILPNFSTLARNTSIVVNNTMVPVQQAGAAGTFRQRLVRLLNYNTLGRMPTQSEEEFQVNSNQSTLALVTNFFGSQEFAQSGKLVAGLYIALLDRDAEYAGWIFQRNALTSRFVNQVQLTGNFVGSQEYTQRFGSPTVSQFVRLLYQNVLGRVPSAGEEAFQVNAVNVAGRATVATNFMGVEEFRLGRLPRFDSFLAYAAILNRDPTTEERQSLRTRLEAGVTMGTILQEIVSSFEFSQRLQ